MKENEILYKQQISDNIIEFKIHSSLVSKNCLPGQFVIIRANDKSERIPLTIFKYNREEKSISVLVQNIGFSTREICNLGVGDCVSDLLGPLGNHTELIGDKFLLVSGGIGLAVIYSQAIKLKSEGKRVDIILAAKTKDLIFYEDEISKCADNLYIVTDDGSYGNKGYAVDELKRVLNKDTYDAVFAVGPMIMMKTICDATRGKKIKTVVSMNSIMVDGTGMCGSCRLSYDSKIKYACIDGPEFDGHLINFDEAIKRSKIYNEHEHKCNLRDK